MESAKDFGRFRGRGRGRSQRTKSRLRGRGRGRSHRLKPSTRHASRSRNYLWSRNDPDYYNYYGNYDYNGDYYDFDSDYDDYVYDFYDYDYGKQRPSRSTPKSATSATSIKSMPAVPSMGIDIDPGRNPYPPSNQNDGGYDKPASTGTSSYSNPPVGFTSDGGFHLGNGLTLGEWANDVRTHSEWFG